ncbi:MAG: helicase C-terminal domain-containing protein [Agitococcus sp.]|nr:helicase C-terminal domain-containing protein [Agitococcus sp.]MDO9179241.1 helicase C-terminal domain-containing protein [Agitococcus sp.]
MSTEAPINPRITRAFAWVDAAYAKLASNLDFVVRQQQKELSYDVASAFITRVPLGAEAPTGTGKTLAYLIGALAATESSGSTTKEPVVVSTATKALQQQIITKDFPTLVQAGLLSEDAVTLAKGKSNYLCLNQAEEYAILLEQAGAQEGLAYNEAQATLASEQVAEMVIAFNEHTWNGDFDTYTGPRPKSVIPIAVSTDTCIKKKCPHFNDCSYYKARGRLGTAKVIIANHDIVLMDLLFVSQKMEPTLPVPNYYVVFDEAHHLPEKAIKVGATEATLHTLQLLIPSVKGIQQLLKTTSTLAALVNNRWEVELDVLPVMQPLRDLMQLLNSVPVESDSCQFRFAKGVVPSVILVAVENLKGPLRVLHAMLESIVGALRDTQDSLDPSVMERASEIIRRSISVTIPAKAVLENFVQLTSPARTAKWLYKKERVVSLHTSPLEGADVLQPLLWNSTRTLGVVMASATLRDLGGFSRFAQKVGSPKQTQYKTLPYTFPYEKSQLVVAAMHATPKPVERKQFILELALKLPKAINSKEGTLILFPSWSLLREFTPRLKAAFGEVKVRVQGEHPVKMLLQSHCQAIDKGDGSILMGVATLAEGLDLPGTYCTHVIVVTLPFAVPNDPVEQEIAEILGSRYFSERSLPDATTRLIQMVGRLLRRESDIGRITIFDRRLVATNYGRQMLANLPPFEKIIEPLIAA